ncbi:MAG: tyrosine-type recombinase/integrase [Clostridia bacterium]|nr:tyrosine-type recombinase/integrase [Clostridia bacterium]
MPSFCSNYFLGIEHTTSLLTRINYAYDLNVFFYFLVNEIDFFKDKSIFDISASDLEAINTVDLEHFLSYLSYYNYYGKECSNNEKAKARKLSAVKSLFQYLFNKDMIISDITQKIKAPKLHEKEIVRLETDEVVKLLNIAENGNNLSEGQKRFHKNLKERDLAILTLFLGTGIRISECVGINIQDINFDNNSFKVLRKGGNEAILYFSEEIANALKPYLIWRSKKLAQKNIQEDALFISLQLKRISMRAVENLVKKYCKIITPLKTITPHKLRSTYGTALYRETKDIYIVADVLGHKDVNTTKKHYAAISDDIRRQAASKVKLRDDDKIL